MRHVNYVSLYQIVEKVKGDELPNVNTKEMQIKEWIYEALRFIGAGQVYEETEIELTLDKDKRARMPDHLNYVRVVKDEYGNDLEEIHTNFIGQLSNHPAYFFRGRFIYTNCNSNKLKVAALQIPRDERGDPLVIDTPYVVAAVVAYVSFRVAKRLWLTKRLSDSKFYYFEGEWLFYAGAAEADLNMPSFDELRSFETLNIGFPITQLSKGGNYYDQAKAYVSPTNEIV